MAYQKIDVKKLVGKWSAEDEDAGTSMVVEFTKDGQLKVTAKEKKGKDVQLNGTYTVDGDKVAVTFKAGDKEFKETLTIVKLTDDELVTKDSKGKKDTFERMEEKLRRATFDLNDFLAQFKMIRKLGPLENILAMLPGMSNMKDFSVDEKQLKRVEAIVLSMTPGERTNPDILNARRRQRIARGSGAIGSGAASGSA